MSACIDTGMMRMALAVSLVACSSNHAPPDGASCGQCDAPPGSPTPTLISTFAGEVGASGTRVCGSAGTNCAYKDHPDATIATNGAYLVEVTGQSITVFDAATGTQVTQTGASAFVVAAGGTAPTATGVNDPYVDWNEFVDRWVVSVPTNAQDFLAVSATSDPTGAWSGVALTGTNAGDITMKLAHDKNGEYVGELAADGGGVPDPNTAGNAWYCFAIPSAELAWTANFNPAHRNKANCAYEARPVMDHDPNKAPTAPFYFAGKTCPSSPARSL